MDCILRFESDFLFIFVLISMPFPYQFIYYEISLSCDCKYLLVCYLSFDIVVSLISNVFLEFLFLIKTGFLFIVLEIPLLLKISKFHFVIKFLNI